MSVTGAHFETDRYGGRFTVEVQVPEDGTGAWLRPDGIRDYVAEEINRFLHPSGRRSSSEGHFNDLFGPYASREMNMDHDYLSVDQHIGSIKAVPTHHNHRASIDFTSPQWMNEQARLRKDRTAARQDALDEAEATANPPLIRLDFDVSQVCEAAR